MKLKQRKDPDLKRFIMDPGPKSPKVMAPNESGSGKLLLIMPTPIDETVFYPFFRFFCALVHATAAQIQST